MRSRRTGGDSGGGGSVAVSQGANGAMEVADELYGSELEGISSTAKSSSSEVTHDVCGELPSRCEEGPSMTEAQQNKWTEEKHSSYLNSMEASFVRQLQNQDCFSAHLLNWLSKKRKLLNQRPVHPVSGSRSVVGQDGCWQRLNFDDNDSQEDARKEADDLSVNPSTRHFIAASSSKVQREISSRSWGETSPIVERSPSCERNEGVSNTSQTYLREMPSHHSHLRLEKTFGNSMEVSDQNFSDEEDKEKSLAKRRRMKWLQKRHGEASGVDQVVPFHQMNLDDPTHI